MGEHSLRHNSNFLGGGIFLKIPLAFIFALFLAVPALATHVSTVTVSPSMIAGGEDDLLFTATACNQAGSPHEIHEFRVYYEYGNFVEFSDIQCQPKPGWYGPFDINGIFGQFCLYSSSSSANNISGGECEDFTFTADTPETECCRTVRYETRDTEEHWQFKDADVCVDTTPPETTKTLGNPLFMDGLVEYITSLSPITLSATDSIGPHDTGISGTFWRNSIVDNSYCYAPETCPQAECESGSSTQTETLFLDEFSSTNPLSDGWTGMYAESGDSESLPNDIYTENSGPSPGSGGYYMVTEDDAAAIRTIDTTGCDDIELSYYRRTNNDAEPSDQFVVEWRIGNAGSWNTIERVNSSESWAFKSFTLPDSAENQAAIQIRFWLDDGEGEKGKWDDVKVTCEKEVEVPCQEEFLPYTETILKAEESCHLLEFYSTDGVGNEESVKKNCFFVDNTPPVISKEVGQPSIPVDDSFDYWVTQDTPITLTCTDQEPHPVNHDTIHWMITVDGVPGSEQSEQTGQKVINFTEDSVHTLEAWCVDALGNESSHDVETFKVDSTPPEISKTMLGLGGTDYLGSCPPQSIDENCYVADNGRGGVSVSVSDPDPTGYGCNVDSSICIAKIFWQTTLPSCENAGGDYNAASGLCLLDTVQFGEGEGTEIIFQHDSTHFLQVECEDALGNYSEDIEKFLVDSTPPETVKTYGDPHYPANINDPAPYPHYITTSTPITLTAADAKVGVDKTYWRSEVVEDRWCQTEASGCQNYEGELPGWSEYDGQFSMPEESCHIIEFYSIDLLGNEESANRQCVFVDDSAPDLNKEVGEPKVACDPEDTLGCDYYITQQTPVTLSCEDKLPHPVGHVSLLYRYRFNDNCAFDGDEGWTEWIDPPAPTLVEKTLYFTEDSCHELEYYCEDALGNSTQTYSEIDVVDTEAPEIELEIDGPSAGECNEDGTGGEGCYIDGVTLINVTATDPEPHPVNEVSCEWSYVLDDQNEYGPFDTFPISFPEETTHYLSVVCWDALGNSNGVRAVYNVDKTPPVTTKQYGNPFINREDGEWINAQTPITLAVEDAGPHKSGIKETKYRVSLVADEQCDRLLQDYCTAEGSGEWQDYEGTFNIPEESCHLIEYYSADNVDKTEEAKRQCVYVDNSAPVPAKTVGKPSSHWDGADSIFYPEIAEQCWQGENPLECWKVTLLTPITLDCNDVEPHPVNSSTICYKVELDGDDATQQYCGDAQLNENGYCCTQNAPKEFYFAEETEHNLDFYCTDALGNGGFDGVHDDEKFKVEGTAFTIELNKKWNLISVPFVLKDSDPEAVFEDVAANVQSVWAFDAFTNQWYVYNPANPGASNLNEILPGWGYWLAAYNADELVLGGSLFSPITTPPSRDLKKGWNLIGYYGTDGVEAYGGSSGFGPKIAGCALYSLGDSVLDKGWTSLLTYWEPDNPNQWKPYDYFDLIGPGAGYWVSASEDSIYEYTTNCGGLII